MIDTSFGFADLVGVQTPHDDPLVVTLRVHECDIQIILIDRRSSANVLFLDTFKKLWLNESQIHFSISLLVGFERTKVALLRMITLIVEAIERTSEVESIVLDVKSA